MIVTTRLGSLAILAALFCIPLHAQTLETVKIVNIGHGYYAGALYVAMQEKLFEKHGLKPELTVVQGGPLALQAVLTKQVDVGAVSYEHVLTAAAQGKRIVAIFNLTSRPVNNVTADSELVKGSENLSIEEKFKRLKGLKVGLPSANGSGEKMLMVLAKKYKLRLPEDISTVYLGGDPASYVAAFQRKLINAALAVEPAGVMVQEAGRGQVYINVMNGEVPEFRNLINQAVATHPDIMKEKPEMLRKVARVFTEAARLLKNDPARGKAILAKEYPNMSGDSNSRVYDAVYPAWTIDGRMTEEQARAVFAYLEPEGPVAINFPSTFTNEFLP